MSLTTGAPGALKPTTIRVLNDRHSVYTSCPLTVGVKEILEEIRSKLEKWNRAVEEIYNWIAWPLPPDRMTIFYHQTNTNFIEHPVHPRVAGVEASGFQR
jgi:hypothetical protein